MSEPTTQDYIWASGHFLGKHLPSDFEEWEEEKLNKFLTDNAWEFFEYCDPNFIWEQIDSLAWSVRKYIQEEHRTNEFKKNVIKYMEKKRGVRL
tara:strand:- start:166 stop:447 length:282 start_codon:yes stop_codon:yes gene_type:complete